MSITAMKQALEALEELNKVSIGVDAVCLPGEIDTAMDALRLAIEQAEKQEPVAFNRKAVWNVLFEVWNQNISASEGLQKLQDLYTTPPTAQRQWVGLTDSEIEEWDYDVRDVVMDIEKLLREKNT